MPTIGVTRCSSLGDYLEALRLAGAAVEILAPGRPEPALDGLVLTGGADVDPRFYGGPGHATIRPAEPGRDELEIDLARRAVADGLPLLAICRGMQVLNVAHGGTLIDDIPSRLPSALPHQVREPPDAIAHDVHVLPGSRLRDLLGTRAATVERCGVNSRHHQAVDRVAAGLTVTATAPDGVIEALERPGAAFCLAVQWHPENFHRSGAFAPLFAALVQAAAR